MHLCTSIVDMVTGIHIKWDPLSGKTLQLEMHLNKTGSQTVTMAW